jgi:hypothetical protein
MDGVLLLVSLLLAVPTYGISILILLIFFHIRNKKKRNEIFFRLIREKALYGENGYMDLPLDIKYDEAELYAKDSGNITHKEKGFISFYTFVNDEKIVVKFASTVNGLKMYVGHELTAEEERNHT